MNASQILLKYWGYKNFRSPQDDIIDSVLAGKDTLALMPTGGGKSVCYQVPALASDGLCIVISPLIALMKDQVEDLKKRGIKALVINSAMTKREIDIALDNCVYGDVKLLYVSPERISTDIFKVRVKKMKVNLVAVDEAHCISQWGYDFRPSYMKIAELRELLPAVPVLALTASATDEVIKDMVNSLKFQQGHNIIRSSFERKNLSYHVEEEEDKNGRLLNVLANNQGSSIVYVRTRKKAGDIARLLLNNKVSAEYYHAGIPPKVRDDKQNRWMNNKVRVMVATSAFGMGINKSNVRTVIHLDIPESVEAYFQEAGRVGRDGKPAFAYLLYHASDIVNLQQIVAQKFPSVEEIKRTYTALANYLQLATGSGEGLSFEFDIAAFIAQYGLNNLLAYNCLSILEQEGYIQLNESFHQPSRVMITVSKDDLYNFQVKYPQYDFFIKTLLRTYPGIFDLHVKINEDQLAGRLEEKISDCLKMLNTLHNGGIINYIPRSDLPRIHFLKERMDDKNLYISKEALKQRKERAIGRMEWMIHYATSANKCRSQVLLSYFGEKDVHRCGICDVCLQRNTLSLNNIEFETVSDQIKKQLKDNPQDLTELINHIDGSRQDKTIKVVQWLLDNNKLKYNEDNKLFWSK